MTRLRHLKIHFISSFYYRSPCAFTELHWMSTMRVQEQCTVNQKRCCLVRVPAIFTKAWNRLPFEVKIEPKFKIAQQKIRLYVQKNNASP